MKPPQTTFERKLFNLLAEGGYKLKFSEKLEVMHLMLATLDEYGQRKRAEQAETAV